MQQRAPPEDGSLRPRGERKRLPARLPVPGAHERAALCGGLPPPGVLGTHAPGLALPTSFSRNQATQWAPYKLAHKSGSSAQLKASEPNSQRHREPCQAPPTPEQGPAGPGRRAALLGVQAHRHLVSTTTRGQKAPREASPSRGNANCPQPRGCTRRLVGVGTPRGWAEATGQGAAPQGAHQHPHQNKARHQGL